MRCEALAAVAKDSWQKLLIIPCAYPTNRITSIISCFWQTTLENQLTIFIRQPALSPSVQDFPCSNVAYIFFLKYIRKNLRTSRSFAKTRQDHLALLSTHFSIGKHMFPLPDAMTTSRKYFFLILSCRIYSKFHKSHYRDDFYFIFDTNLSNLNCFNLTYCLLKLN